MTKSSHSKILAKGYLSYNRRFLLLVLIIILNFLQLQEVLDFPQLLLSSLLQLGGGGGSSGGKLGTEGGVVSLLPTLEAETLFKASLSLCLC